MNACDSGPCLNAGTCTSDSDNGYLCNCNNGFSGQHCEKGNSQII